MKKKYIGSNFDDFLKQEGLLVECKANARKRVAAKKVSTSKPLDARLEYKTP